MINRLLNRLFLQDVLTLVKMGSIYNHIIMLDLYIRNSCP